MKDMGSQETVRHVGNVQNSGSDDGTPPPEQRLVDF